MNFAELSDAQLVQRTLMLNDRAAYSLLVRRHQHDVRAFLARLTRQRESADDLAQETFLQGFRTLNQLHEAAKYRGWIFTIARTEFLQWRRKRSETPLAELPPEDALPPTLDQKIEVQTLLQTLRAEEREAVILCLGHDFSHAEAAGILDLPVGTVKSLLLRARQKMIKENL